MVHLGFISVLVSRSHYDDRAYATQDETSLLLRSGKLRSAGRRTIIPVYAMVASGSTLLGNTLVLLGIELFADILAHVGARIRMQRTENASR
ncbi:hypothetical protein SISNIDRAFT_453984 [Sistotremastrum niveocremeum HHB9708]|uniref:Uncharacterized protein n=2 Tax=Sistotremastraceae TaxID=3402574 RepID=A0A164VKY9_9AGAM|nr:hypothetical protein SISNIDRAFT_453984 [Sistotremastrum niveocremeum HHB9708]KZT41199.1 hypothetical protein SISSUDRAFT_1043027 [Sistotremastrum suecicum HHB10207 ss-3]